MKISRRAFHWRQTCGVPCGSGREGSGLEQGFRGRKHIQLLVRLWGVCLKSGMHIIFVGLFSAMFFCLLSDVCVCVSVLGVGGK